MQRLPWLLFGLLAGAIVDRVDRRLLSAAVDAARAVVVGALVVTIATDAVTAPFVYAAMFLLGTAETLADNAASALVADTVPRDALGIANARLIGSVMMTNQLAGPPIGRRCSASERPFRSPRTSRAWRRGQCSSPAFISARPHHPARDVVRCGTRSPKVSCGSGGIRRSAPWR